ncbi:hypothetical protein O3M35_002941 [Rhynocoris fuscipes]|uniref:PHD-type domain-containing protein n=1 Tax=Rhynocoris fuscipes TaxID=488301 RepID=A0AAW1CPT0_9HEMI
MDDHHYFMQPGGDCGSPNPAGSQKRPVVLGVVNTLGMKSTNQKRKRRWDQPPEEIDSKKVRTLNNDSECSSSFNIIDSEKNSDIFMDVNSLINVNNEVLIESDELCKESDSSDGLTKPESSEIERHELDTNSLSTERTLETVNSIVIEEEKVVNESISVDIALDSNISDGDSQCTNNNLVDPSESVDTLTFVSSMSDSLKQIQYYDEEDSNSEDSSLILSHQVNPSLSECSNSSEILMKVATTDNSINNDNINQSSEYLNKNNAITINKAELPSSPVHTTNDESIDLVQVINDQSSISHSEVIVSELDTEDNTVTIQQSSDVCHQVKQINPSVACESESLSSKIDLIAEKDSSMMEQLDTIQQVDQQLVLETDTNDSAKLEDVLKTNETISNLEMEPAAVEEEEELWSKEEEQSAAVQSKQEDLSFSKKHVLQMERDFTFGSDTSGIIEQDQDQASITEDLTVRLLEKSQAKYETDIKKVSLSEELVNKETSSNESWKTVVTFDEDKIVSDTSVLKAVSCELKEDSNDKLEYLSPTSGSELQSDDQIQEEVPSDEPVESLSLPLVQTDSALDTVKEEVVVEDITNEFKEHIEAVPGERSDKVTCDKEEEIIATDVVTENDENSSSVRVEESKDESDNIIMTGPNPEDIPEFAIVDDLNEPINIEETENEVIIETEEVESLFDENLENQDILMEVDAEFEDTKRLLCTEIDVDNENIQSAHSSSLITHTVQLTQQQPPTLSKLTEPHQFISKQAAEKTEKTKEVITTKEPALELSQHISSKNSILHDRAVLLPQTVLVKEVITDVESNDKKSPDIELNSVPSESSSINKSLLVDERSNVELKIETADGSDENNDSVLLKPDSETEILETDPVSQLSSKSPPLSEASTSIPVSTPTIDNESESIKDTSEVNLQLSKENVHISEFSPCNKVDNDSDTCKNVSSLEQEEKELDEEQSEKKNSDEKEVLETIRKDMKTDADSEVSARYSPASEEVIIDGTPQESLLETTICTSASVEVDAKDAQPIGDSVSSNLDPSKHEQISQMEVISAVEAISSEVVVSGLEQEQDTLGIDEEMVEVPVKDHLQGIEDVLAIDSIREGKEVEELDLVDNYELEVIAEPLKKDDVAISPVQIKESTAHDPELQHSSELSSIPMDTSEKELVTSSTELEVAIVEEQNTSTILSRQAKSVVHHSYEDAVKETSSNESWKTVVTYDEDKGINEEMKNLAAKEDFKDTSLLEIKEDSIDKLEYLSPTGGSELQTGDDDQLLAEVSPPVVTKDTDSSLTSARSSTDNTANIQVKPSVPDIKENIAFEESLDDKTENEKSLCSRPTEHSILSDNDNKVNPVNIESSNRIKIEESNKTEKVESSSPNKEEEEIETDTGIVFGDDVEEMEDDMEASICVQETDNEVVIESEEMGFLFDDKISTNEDVGLEGDGDANIADVDGTSGNEKMEVDDGEPKEDNVIVEKIFDRGLLMESENMTSDENILDIVEEDTLEKADKPVETVVEQVISEEIISDEKVEENKNGSVCNVDKSKDRSVSSDSSWSGQPTEHDNLVPLLKTVPISDKGKAVVEKEEEVLVNFQPSRGELQKQVEQPAQKLEPITLRIYKDNLSIRTDDLDSPKRHRSPTLASGLKSQLSPQVKGSPTGGGASSPQTKQLEFTLKIAKDANTNIPKATMSPKSNLSPSGVAWQADMSPGSSSSLNKESHSPGQASPTTSESTLNKLKLKICKPNENVEVSKQPSISGVVLESKSSPLKCTENNSTSETSPQASSKLEEFRTPKSHLKLETMFKKMLESQIESKPTKISSGEVVSSIGSSASDLDPAANSEKLSEPLVTVSTPVIPTPRKRGRPRKIVTLPVEQPMSSELSGNNGGEMQQSFSVPDSASAADNINRPMRSCRGRTKPIVVRTRKPRGGGMMRGGGRGRGITRITPDRETLTEYEKAELAKIEAKKERLRAESIARYEAKKAKKLAKKLKDEERRKRLAREKAEKAEAAAPQVFEEETRMSAPDNSNSRGHTPYRSSNQTALASMRRDGCKIEPREQALEAVASWNANLNRERKEERRCALDLQTFTIHYPKSDRTNMTRPVPKVGLYPIALIPGQYCDYYKQYTPTELMYFPLNTVVYGPLKPNERQQAGASDDGSASDSDTSSDDDSSESSSESSDSSEEQDDTRKCCKICKTSKKSNKDSSTTSLLESSMIQCAHCKSYYHASCQDFAEEMLPHIRKYDWSCIDCKKCLTCKSRGNVDKILCCDLCDRGHHVECLGLKKVPERWHCNVCAYCTNCGSRDPGAPDWQHEYKKGDKGIKVYSRTLCATCSKMANVII